MNIRRFWKKLIIVTFSGVSFERRSNIRYLAVFPEKRIVYNRIKKSGNSSLLISLNSMLSSKEIDKSHSYEYAKIDAERMSAWEALSLRESLSLRYYYKITVFRNPWIRCLSAFLQKVAAGGGRNYKMVPGYLDDSKQGFGSFVEYLYAGGWKVNSHFYPQTQLLAWHPSAYDFIGQLESCDEQLYSFLDYVNVVPYRRIDLSRPSEVETVGGYKITGASSKLEKYYDKDTYRKVKEVYREDFYWGNYDRG